MRPQTRQEQMMALLENIRQELKPIDGAWPDDTDHSELDLLGILRNIKADLETHDWRKDD